jgi:imidazolonepropionase-like amidohydrolase
MLLCRSSRVFLAALLLSPAVFSQETPIAFTGARMIPISGPEIPDSVLVVQNGKILAAGAASAVRVPTQARQVDLKGKVLMPGLVDSHSHIAGPEGADASAPIQPDVRILDSLNMRDARVRKAQAGGITTVNVMPGSGHLLSGQTLYLKLRAGKDIEDFLIRLDGGRIAGGIKMANGTNSRRTAPFPGTRGKSAALVREQFVKAQEYREKVRKADGDASKLPPRDLRLESLAEVLDGKRVVHFHSHRHDDILTALRLSKEFEFRVVLQHVSDAWMVAGEIAKAKAPASLLLLDSPGGKIEAKDNRIQNGAALETAGALTGFHTDDGITDSRFFLRQPALAVRGGMSREKALYGVTMANAIMLELDKRVGSLEEGKDADFIVLSGDPLSVYTVVLETWVEGKKVFDRSNEKDRLYAVGGYGASHDQPAAMLHAEEEAQ